ncbi:Bromodomain containing protein [Tritrichomonas foetus]|uniref:Bromodomain containing protein n=1 Tax=Tritrichomonas foetus TaxID=1144522 RepID=A0A1J4KCS1_9EUKA|nr:Bromodomain containing protein [Tritrichomonas foetus]|eukprot:OHT08736.1 Bromodomain containing protein [Tritrichomonas foetus]
MNDETIVKCRKIMHHLNDHPLAIFFKDKVDTTLYPDYLRVISEPSDITTVKTRLVKKKYESVEKWNRDVELIFDNCIQYNGKNTDLAAMAQHLRKVYHKLKKEYLFDCDWCAKRCVELQNKLDRLLVNCPKSLKNVDAFQEIRNTASTERSDIKNDQLIKTLNSYKSKEQQIQLLCLLQECEPKLYEGQNDLNINIDRLRPETITKLNEFVSLNPPQE